MLLASLLGGGDNDGLRSSMLVHVGQVYRVLFVEGFRGPQGDWPSDNGGYVCRSKVSSEIQCRASLWQLVMVVRFVTVSYSYHAGVVMLMLMFNATYTDSSIVVRYNSTMFDEGFASLPMVVEMARVWLCGYEDYVRLCILNCGAVSTACQL